MRDGNIRSGIERDAAELFVVQFQRVPSLLDVPICYARPRCQTGQEDLDLRPAEIPASPPGVLSEETPYPPEAVGNGLFLGAGFAQNPDVPPRPAWLRVQRRGGPIPVLTHSRHPVSPICVNLSHERKACQRA